MRYVLDPAQSRLSAHAFSTGMLASMGHNPTFAARDLTGELHFDPATNEAGSFRLSVKSGSLALTDSVSARDREEIEGRMRREVLETAKFPEIVYDSAEIKADTISENWYRFLISGELSLHGVKRRHQADAQLRLSDGQARLSGRCPLTLSAYRIKPVTALGGLIKLKDELAIEFDIVCTRQDG
jgi:polyisoprenoid-binding protein YceI